MGELPALLERVLRAGHSLLFLVDHLEGFFFPLLFLTIFLFLLFFFFSLPPQITSTIRIDEH